MLSLLRLVFEDANKLSGFLMFTRSCVREKNKVSFEWDAILFGSAYNSWNLYLWTGWVDIWLTEGTNEEQVHENKGNVSLLFYLTACFQFTLERKKMQQTQWSKKITLGCCIWRA